MAATWRKLAYEDDVVTKALFDANSILAAVDDNTPAAVAVAEQQVVGRITGGNIKGLSIAEILTLINVTAGAQPTNATTVEAANAVMITDYTAKGDLMSANAANSPMILGIGTNGQVLTVLTSEATGLVWGDAAAAAGGTIPNYADAAARPVAPALGDLIFQVDELAYYGCTVIA